MNKKDFYLKDLKLVTIPEFTSNLILEVNEQIIKTLFNAELTKQDMNLFDNPIEAESLIDQISFQNLISPEDLAGIEKITFSYPLTLTVKIPEEDIVAFKVVIHKLLDKTKEYPLHKQELHNILDYLDLFQNKFDSHFQFYMFEETLVKLRNFKNDLSERSLDIVFIWSIRCFYYRQIMDAIDETIKKFRAKDIPWLIALAKKSQGLRPMYGDETPPNIQIKP